MWELDNDPDNDVTFAVASMGVKVARSVFYELLGSERKIIICAPLSFLLIPIYNKAATDVISKKRSINKFPIQKERRQTSSKTLDPDFGVKFLCCRPAGALDQIAITIGIN